MVQHTRANHPTNPVDSRWKSFATAGAASILVTESALDALDSDGNLQCCIPGQSLSQSSQLSSSPRNQSKTTLPDVKLPPTPRPRPARAPNICCNHYMAIHLFPMYVVTAYDQTPPYGSRTR